MCVEGGITPNNTIPVTRVPSTNRGVSQLESHLHGRSLKLPTVIYVDTKYYNDTTDRGKPIHILPPPPHTHTSLSHRYVVDLLLKKSPRIRIDTSMDDLIFR